ncbi:tRNA dimethylallyltransferase [Peptostreptococcaceae bacterium oral taxon 113 str. W5053]|nr:tRNA dimethylallyltransferase [Peptostreptococcaceae bacterium oral taxon 113 str. W5053]
MNKLIFIIGPTGVGKSNLSLYLAKSLETEIISTDSMQIYRFMNIGTAKVTEKEQENIRHHCIDIVNPDELFTVDDFQKMSSEIIKNLWAKNKIPIFVGGTGLYANSILYELKFLGSPNYEIREHYKNYVEKFGAKKLHELLEKVDPLTASKIHENNVKRVIRALEIYEDTGRKMSEQNLNFRAINKKYDPFIIGLSGERELIYNRINIRVEQMISDGLVEEVKEILCQFPNFKETIASKGIGYKEVIPYLDGKISKEQMIADIQQHSRNYAKRQWTWFKKDGRIRWYDIQNGNINESILKDIVEWSKQ